MATREIDTQQVAGVRHVRYHAAEAARFEEEGVTHQLYVKDGGDHGWKISAEEASMIADWFDQHL